MKQDHRKAIIVCGALGPAVLLLGCIGSAALYQGRHGERFSPLNHFVSELGERGVSSAAPLFNGALFLSGLLFAAFTLALAQRMGGRLAWSAGIMGAFAGVACAAVGLVPMELTDLRPHVLVALAFFHGGLAAIVLFTAAILLHRDPRLSRWLALPSVVCVAAFAAFLNGHRFTTVTPMDLMDPSRPGRPVAAVLPTLEWLVLATVLVWFVLASVDVARQRPGIGAQREPGGTGRRPTWPAG